MYYFDVCLQDEKKRVAEPATLIQKFELKDQSLMRRARSG